MTDQKDQILRALSLINGIKSNVPKDTKLPERWVQEYHNALQKVETAMDADLADFRIEESDLAAVPVSSNVLTGETRYSGDRYCEKALLLQKVDSVLNYLNSLLRPPEKKMGF